MNAPPNDKPDEKDGTDSSLVQEMTYKAMTGKNAELPPEPGVATPVLSDGKAVAVPRADKALDLTAKPYGGKALDPDALPEK